MVEVADRVEISPVLKIESQDETISVNDEVDILQTATSALGRAVGSPQLTELPLVTRNFTHLTALSPGVSMTLSDSLARLPEITETLASSTSAATRIRLASLSSTNLIEDVRKPDKSICTSPCLALPGHT